MSAPPASALQRANTPRPLTILALVLLAGGVGAGFALAWVPWQQTAIGQGGVVAFAPTDRPQRVDAPFTGRVEEWLVTEGQQVKAGDPIARLSDIDPDYVQRLESQRSAVLDRVAAATARVSSYKSQQAAYERVGELAVEAARLEVKMAEQKVLAAQQKRSAAVAAERTARLQRERIRRLKSEGLASQREVELASLSLAKAETELRSATAGVSEARAYETAAQAKQLREDAQAGAKVASAGAETQKSEAEVAYARGELVKIESALARQESRMVRTPRNGYVLELAGHAGGMVVKQGEQLSTIVPLGGRIAVELWVDGNDAPLVNDERRVRLQFEGWPALQMSGWPNLAVGTFGGRVAFVDRASRKEGSFRVVVIPDEQDRPWPDREFLRQGVRAKGWVLLDEVSVGYELWRQFNGFPRAVPRRGATDAKAAKEAR